MTSARGQGRARIGDRSRRRDMPLVQSLLPSVVQLVEAGVSLPLRTYTLCPVVSGHLRVRSAIPSSPLFACVSR